MLIELTIKNNNITNNNATAYLLFLFILYNTETEAANNGKTENIYLPCG